MSNETNKPKSTSKSIRLHSSHLQLLEDVLSKLTPQHLDLMKRTHKLGRKPDGRGNNDPSNEGALLAHALIVGLIQLHQSLAPSSRYHRQANIELSAILHLCIQDSTMPGLSEVEAMLSIFEEFHQREG